MLNRYFNEFTQGEPRQPTYLSHYHVVLFLPIEKLRKNVDV